MARAGPPPPVLPKLGRLIAKIYQADPLVCSGCGQRMSIVAFVTDAIAIRQILDHLDLSPLEKPPPDVRDVVRVPVDDEGREIAANPA